MDIRGKRCDVVDLNLARDSVQFRVFRNTIMKLRVPYKTRNFMESRSSVRDPKKNVATIGKF
jgi:hypothetical protein